MKPTFRAQNIILIFSYLILVIKSTKKEKCGKPLGSEFILQSDRVVAGYDVGYYRYPWYAALIRAKQVSCGGALIGPRTVLTAAHCYKEYLEQANKTSLKLEDIYTVRLGMYNICITEKSVTEYRVEKVHVHELYLNKTPYFDICVLILANGTDDYMPVCLPSSATKSRPREGTVPGLGTLKYQGPMPCTLHEARLLIYPDNECRDMINRTGNDPKAISKAFCAGYMNGGIDTCQGDSGGPLQCMDDQGRYVLLGIVSFGFHCALPGYLGMYTDVSQYIDWIRERSQSDLEFINSFANETELNSTSTEESDDHKKKKKHYYHEHPYRIPLRIIILSNHGLVSIVKPMLHYPIKRIYHKNEDKIRKP